MALNGRQKGSRCEREVAGIIQTWWSQLEPNCEMVRTPLSGGWGNAKVRGEFKASGDLMTTAKRFPFVVEVKAREGWSLKNMMNGKRSPVWGWWRQSITAAQEQEGGIPMLWVTQKANRKPGQTSFPWLVIAPAAWVAARTLLAPDVTFPSPSLLGVNYGGHRPVLYFADRLISMHPKDVI